MTAVPLTVVPLATPTMLPPLLVYATPSKSSEALLEVLPDRTLLARATVPDPLLLMPPPPEAVAVVFADKVLSDTTKVAALKMPPPGPEAPLPVTVSSLNVKVPLL